MHRLTDVLVEYLSTAGGDEQAICACLMAAAHAVAGLIVATRCADGAPVFLDYFAIAMRDEPDEECQNPERIANPAARNPLAGLG